jgi:hypothetical protein
MTVERTAPAPACWSWPPERPTNDDLSRRFWEGIDTTGYSASALELLQEAADALHNDEETLRTWQAGRCAICGETGRRMVCDHDHESGLVRGWLCSSCNTREGVAIGFPGTIMAAYRERPPTTILALTIRYKDPISGQLARPQQPVADGWDDNSTADLT